MDIHTTFERARLRRSIGQLYNSKYRDSLKREHPASEAFGIIAEQFERESSPWRARLREIESAELVDRAMKYGIIIADLAPLRFGGPLWLEEADCRYLSVEGKQAVRKAILEAQKERIKFVASLLGPLTGVIGALTGVIALLKK